MSSRLLAYNSNDEHYEPLVLQNGTQYLYVTSPTLDDILVDSDSCVSKLTDISQHTTLTASRLSNVQDWVGTSDGLGGGAKTGVNIAEILVDTDQCVSKLTTIESQSVTTASRLSNVQDWVGTSDGAGGGVKTGVHIASLAGCVAGSELQVDIVSGSVSISGGATEAKQDTMETSLNAIETLITSSNTKLDTLETTANAVETLITSTNTKIDTLDAVVDLIKTNSDLTIYGSANNLYNSASCVSAGTDSAVVDWGSGVSPKLVQISVLATSSTAGSGMEIYCSHDGTNYARMQVGSLSTFTLATSNSAGGAINSQSAVVIDWGGHRYLKVRIHCLATFSGTATALR